MATPDDPTSWIDLLSGAGTLGFAIMFGWLFLTDRIVTGKRYERDTELLRQERDQAIDLLFHVTGITDKAVSLTEERLQLEKRVIELQTKTRRR